MKVIITDSAKKDLSKLPSRLRQRIVNALFALEDPEKPIDMRKLQGTEDLWRLRVGDYRHYFVLLEKKSPHTPFECCTGGKHIAEEVSMRTIRYAVPVGSYQRIEKRV